MTTSHQLTCLGLILSAVAALSTSPMGHRYFDAGASRKDKAHVALIICTARTAIKADDLIDCFNRLFIDLRPGECRGSHASCQPAA